MGEEEEGQEGETVGVVWIDGMEGRLCIDERHCRGWARSPGRIG